MKDLTYWRTHLFFQIRLFSILFLTIETGSTIAQTALKWTTDDLIGIANDKELDVHPTIVSLVIDRCPNYHKYIPQESYYQNDGVGRYLQNIGDLDGDGILDAAVGIPTYGSRGSIEILFMNSDGSINITQKINNEEGGFDSAMNPDGGMGYGIAGLGDVDGDGIPDLAVSVFDDLNTTNLNTGAVLILFMNPDGTVKKQQKINTTEGGLTGPLLHHDQFGYRTAGIGDWNGDDIPDLAVTGRGDQTNPSELYILFLNADGTVKAEQRHSFPRLSETTELTILGDVDGDDIKDIAMTFLTYNMGTYIPRIEILFMNADGTIKATQEISNTKGGFSNLSDGNIIVGRAGITALGDMDEDGIPDLGFGFGGYHGSSNNNGAFVLLLLNADGTVKYQQIFSEEEGGLTDQNGLPLTLNSIDGFGNGMTALGDSDENGIQTLLVGANGTDNVPLSLTNTGAIYGMNIRYNKTTSMFEVLSSLPESIVNTIAASSSTARLGTVIAPLNNVAFDLKSSGNRPYTGAEIGLFQWQLSYDGTTWEDIPNATSIDMPEAITIKGDTYFRRLYEHDCSGLISYSNVVLVRNSK